MSARVLKLAGGALLLALFILPFAGLFYGDFLWFVELGYESVFLTIFWYRAGIFAAVTVISFAVFYTVYRSTANRIRNEKAFSSSNRSLAALGLVSVFLGIQYSTGWETVLRFLNAVPFAVSDPVFSRDVGFFVFQLPFYSMVVSYLLFMTGVSLAITLVMYALAFGFDRSERLIEDVVGMTTVSSTEFDFVTYVRKIREHGYGQVMVLLSGLFVALSGWFFLNRFELLYSSSGAVFGVAATESAVGIPVLTGLTAVSFLAAVALLANLKIRDTRVVYAAFGAVILLGVAGQVGSMIHQDYIVEPDEFNKEVEYLQNEINFTRKAFALDRIQEEEFEVSENLTREQIEANPGTIDNVKLWDERPLKETYNELQIFRTYYRFDEIHTDRYKIEDELKQVYISTRELEVDELPEQSQSWVNRHLVYTHGMGVAMSPVSEVTEQKFPEYYIKDVPPKSNVDIQVERPQIYYGETTNDYAIVDTGTRELDYPTSGENVYHTYTGGGGVQMDSIVEKAVYALKFLSPEILLSDSITTDSRIQFNRDLESRVNKIAPFLEYDDDPYPVVGEDGKIYWIYDAYTTSDRYPYASMAEFKGKKINYMRNSVKVVVDAYTGETQFYTADESDPVIDAYKNAFPDMFQSLDAMPDHLRKHIRYPQDAFQVQAEKNLVYHMQDPMEFYNREDVWRIPDERLRGNRVQMEPYYMIMKLPGEEEPEFVQILPFIPDQRENMIGWMAARSDEPHYGEFKSFLFSQQELIFGPMQVESRIDQDPDISERITLWSRAGSNVIRGNLLAIPIDDTILYVEPLFLEAAEQGALPQLQRVITAHNDRLTIQPEFSSTLDVLFGDKEEKPVGLPPELPTGTLQEAQSIYQAAQEALSQSDFVTYAEKMDELGELLQGSTKSGSETLPETGEQ